MHRTAAIAAVIVIVAGLAAGAWFAFGPGSEDPLKACRTTQIAGAFDTIGGPFELVDETGATVTDKQVIDRPALIYFGYTYCPDVCPLHASRNAEAVDMLAEKGIALRPVFISVDPERDTPQIMADYTANLHPEMLGLTGSRAQVDAAMKAYGAYAAAAGEGEDYLVNHTVYSYLMHPEMGLLDVYGGNATAEDIVKSVTCFAEVIEDWPKN
ncbi:MAG: SCO family protein [Alphaproteobacteria bacterium]|nr:MAG: SCO family protein [Alphaproteobacteria bacterium]